MRAITITLHVVALVLMLIGVTVLGTFLGEVFLDAHGGKFFDLKQQLLVAGMLIVLGILFPIFARWSIKELIAAVIMAELVILSVIYYISGGIDWYYFDWVWRVTRFTTLPFAACVAIGYVIAERKKPKTQNGRSVGMSGRDE